MKSKLKATQLTLIDDNNVEHIVHEFEKQGLVVKTKDQLKNALTKIGTSDGTIAVVDTIYIDEDITIPENVNLKFFKGGKLSVSTGYTLTINGGIDAGLDQIFDGDGTITGSPKIETVYPEWFGAKGDGVTDDTNAIQKCVNCFDNITILFNGNFIITDTIEVNSNFLDININGTITYSNSYYSSVSYIKINGTNVKITGGVFDGANNCGNIIDFSVGADYGIISNCVFKNMNATDALDGITGDFSTVVIRSNYCKIYSCSFFDLINTGADNDSFPRAITITGNYNTVEDCNMYNCRDGILTTGSYNYCKNIYIENTTDNGFYYAGSYNTIENIIIKDATDEPLVIKGNFNKVINITIDNSETDTVMNAISFQNAKNFLFDGLNIIGVLKCGNLFKTRGTSAESSNGIIKNVKATVLCVYDLINCATEPGVFELSNCDITLYKDSGYDYSYLFRLSDGSKLIDSTITVEDINGYVSTQTYMYNTGFDTDTSIINTRFIDKSASRVRISSYSGINQDLVWHDGIGNFISRDTTDYQKITFGGAPPSKGKWSLGDIIINTTPSVDANNMVLYGWICTQAGDFAISGGEPVFQPMYISTVSPAT